MKRVPAASRQANRVMLLVSELQQRFVTGLKKLSQSGIEAQRFTAVEWLRDSGLHGGGVRYETADGNTFCRGSVNVSQVHYDDQSNKQLGSATAISTIIHPCNPFVPSIHIHISWTEMKHGRGYWRMMADLNPAIEDMMATKCFLAALKQAAPDQFKEATGQGDHYFYILALKRHRGVAHFYLESYNSGHMENDFSLAEHIGQTAIDTWLSIVEHILGEKNEITMQARQQQLAYHTLYFFQVLTLDRGTTSGLLVHSQNDVGILGSLPSRVDKALLNTWVTRLPVPQDGLLTALIAALPEGSVCQIDDAVKLKLANIVRNHYTEHPEAIAMQACGNDKIKEYSSQSTQRMQRTSSE